MVNKDQNIAIGLNLDHSPLKQPESTYRYAKNVVTAKDSKSSLTVEKSPAIYNENIQGNWLGSCFISPNEQVIFTDENYIYLLNTDTDDLTGYILPNANFNSPIKAESRIINGCERVVYWCDSINPDRFFNFDRVDNFKTNGQFDLDKFKFRRRFFPPRIKTEVTDFGGKLRYGVYNFVIQYLDENENILYTSPVDINYTPIGANNSGALNIDTNSAEVGGRPESSRSIKLEINNLADVDYIRLGVLRTTTGDGLTADAHIVNDILSVQGRSDIEYVYTGFDTDRGDYLIDKNELLVPLAEYKTAKAMEQVQDVLIKGNVTEQVYDYSRFQSYANDVQVKWVAKKEKVNTFSRTRMGGDIKPLGIVYIHEDYTESPVFLLRSTGEGEVATGGRFFLEVYGDINASYRITYTLNEAAGRNVTKSGTLSELTEVIATSLDNITVLDFTSDEGVQYRIYSERTYNTLATVDAEPEVGYDYSGFTGISEIEQTYEQPINFDCKDFNYWDSISGDRVRLHVFPDRSQIPLYERTDGEDYVYNIGLKFSNVNYPEGIIGHYFVEGIDSNIITKGLLTPVEDADATNTRGSYFHVYDGEYPKPRSEYGNLLTPNLIYNKEYINGDRLVEEGQFTYQYSQTDNVMDNIFDSDYPYSDMELDIRQYRVDEFLQTGRTERIIDDSFIIDRESGFNGLFNYSRTNPFNILTFNEEVNYDRDNIMRYVTVYDINPFQNIFTFRFRRITEVDRNVSFAGDAFIGPFAIANIVEDNYRTRLFNGDKINADSETIDGLFIESFINTNLLHDGIDDCDKHYSPSYGIDQGSDPLKSFDRINHRLAQLIREVRSRIIFNPNGGDNWGEYGLRPQACEIWDGYNKDYSRVSQFNVHYILPRSYDFCSDCQGQYPNRIVYSEKSFDEQLRDNYRVIKANNYVDLPANKGAITAIDYKDQQLWVRTEYSCFLLTPNPQQLTLSETTVNIGTGDFLSIPEQELNAVDIGYGGQQHIHESINTDHGLVWIDRNRGKVIKVAGKFEEISRNGMYQYFFDNLPNETNVIMGYDPEYERLMLTHTGTEETISYCFESQMWKSWHEYNYTPQFYLYDSTQLYSTDGSILYKHNGSPLDAIMEVLFRADKGFHPDIITYVADGAFDKVMVYNSTQTSGFQTLDLVERPGVKWGLQSKYQYHDNGVYKINLIRDIKDRTNNNPPLNGNHVPNISTDLNQTRERKFNEKWLAINLATNKNITLDVIGTMLHFAELNFET